MNNWKRLVVHGIISFMLFVVLLFTAVQVVVFNPFYFKWHYTNNQIASTVGVTETELMDVTHKMLRYLESKETNLDFQVATTEGMDEFFDEKDKAHMEDVKILFEYGFFLRNLFLMILVFMAATYYMKKPLAIFEYGQRYWQNMAGVLVLFGMVVAYASIDFESAFILFHKTLFRNDLWLLDPDKSRLINIVPQSFFVNTSVLICVSFIILLILAFLGFKLVERTNTYREGE